MTSMSSLIFGTGRTRAKRAKPSPWLPKPLPGTQMTPVFSMSSRTKASEFSNRAGIFPQANMVPSLSRMSIPAALSPPQRASRRLWYSAQLRFTLS